MDPDVTLANLRSAVIAYVKALEADQAEEAGEAVAEIIGAVVALDSWLSLGGFLPIAWHAKRNGLPASRQDEQHD